MYEEDSPVLILSKPILITKNSNPKLIANFIRNRIIIALDRYYLDHTVLEMIECPDYPEKPGVIIKYNEISIF